MSTMSAETRNSAHDNDKAKGGPVTTAKSAYHAYATAEEICEAVERQTKTAVATLHATGEWRCAAFFAAVSHGQGYP